MKHVRAHANLRGSIPDQILRSRRILLCALIHWFAELFHSQESLEDLLMQVSNAQKGCIGSSMPYYTVIAGNSTCIFSSVQYFKFTSIYKRYKSVEPFKE